MLRSQVAKEREYRRFASMRVEKKPEPFAGVRKECLGYEIDWGGGAFDVQQDCTNSARLIVNAHLYFAESCGGMYRGPQHTGSYPRSTPLWV
jgi:hypothetical protein